MCPANVRFGSQDYWIAQSHHTITYVRALQYWTEKIQPPIPGQPQCLVKSVMELQWAMELLVSFMKVGVFTAAAVSNWMDVSSPRPMEPISQDPCSDHSHSCSHSWNNQACPRGSLLAAWGESWPTTTTRMDVSATPPWEMVPSWSDNKPPCPPPGFVEIAQALYGEEPKESSPPLIIGIPPEEVIELYEAMRTAVTVTHILWHSTTGRYLLIYSHVHWRLWAWGLTPWQWMTT